MLTLPGERRSIGIVRLFVGGLAARLGLGYETMDDLQLALESVLLKASSAAEITLEATIDGRRGLPDRSARSRATRSSRTRPGRTSSISAACSRRSSPGAESTTRDDGCWLRLDVLRPGRQRSSLSPEPAVSLSPSQLEENELLRAYHERGDQSARDRLVEANLPLARAIARRYAGRGEQLDDLVQVASIGLIKAIDRFDLERGVYFRTYAVPTIVGEIKRHFRDRAWAVHVPRRLKELNQMLSSLIQDLSAQLERSPTIAELAEAAGVEEEEVVEALESSRAYTAESLMAPAEEGSDLDRLQTLGVVEEAFERTEDRHLLATGLEALEPRERRIIQLRFQDGLTQTQIANELGISQMHVSRLIRRALETMREELERGGVDAEER